MTSHSRDRSATVPLGAPLHPFRALLKSVDGVPPAAPGFPSALWPETRPPSKSGTRRPFPIVSYAGPRRIGQMGNLAIGRVEDSQDRALPRTDRGLRSERKCPREGA